MPTSAIPARHRAPASARGVYDALRERIVSVEIVPGARLSENELAAAFQVSRTPIREALVLLRSDGLVETLPQRGSFVAPIDLGDLRTAQFVREAIERSAVQRGGAGIPASAHGELDAVLARQDEAGRDGDVARFSRLDDELHELILRACGYGEAWPVMRSQQAHLDRARRLSLSIERHYALVADEHRELVRHLRDGDLAAADRTLRHHLRGVFRDLPTLRNAFPQYFPVDDDA